MVTKTTHITSPKRLSMKFKIEQSSEKINSVGGMVLVGALLNKLGLNEAVDSIQTGKGRPVYSNSSIIRSYMGLLCQGRTSFDDLTLFKNNEFYADSLGIKSLVSVERLRQRLNEGAGVFDASIRQANLALLRNQQFSRVQTQLGSYIPWDCDVSPLDNSRTKKQNVSRTYKAFDGYAPMFGYLGGEGFMLDCELRPGKQHCQSGTGEFLKRGLGFIEKLGLKEKVLLRLDSGNDSTENIELVQGQCDFIIKRNLRKEVREQWLKTAMDLGKKSVPRPGKTVYTGVLYSKQPASEHCSPVPVAFEVTVREIDKAGNYLLFPQLEVDTYWTSLCEDAEEIIRLYHDHGTSEQFHSELKSDMDVERLPSGNFGTNSLILLLSMLAFNCLRSIGQQMLELKEFSPVKLDVKRRRIKSVIRDLMLMACKYVRRSNQRFIKLGKCNPWFKMYEALYYWLAA